MSKRNDISDHINQFNKCITQLLNLEVKIEDEGQPLFCYPPYQNHIRY